MLKIALHAESIAAQKFPAHGTPISSSSANLLQSKGKARKSGAAAFPYQPLINLSLTMDHVDVVLSAFVNKQGGVIRSPLPHTHCLYVAAIMNAIQKATL
ncbi:hypothetical protein DSO57_1034215 [Entomophthora muscae]|uniref:Uncharacterized protein n=1 Tax=Entomophthora muscae TaxID=34485 RepID=A0ACC2TY21_9FUNG|nr:hypothetical protein DSO57_1034215 [Entomophthora muscae]